MTNGLNILQCLATVTTVICFGGDPNTKLLADDGYHLAAKGIFTLAVNIKKTIHLTLKIPIQDRGKSRSRPHYRQNSRRSRGRGYILVYKMSSWDLLSWHSVFLAFLIGNCFHAAQSESLLSDKRCWTNLQYIISGVFFCITVNIMIFCIIYLIHDTHIRFIRLHYTVFSQDCVIIRF